MIKKYKEFLLSKLGKTKYNLALETMLNVED